MLSRILKLALLLRKEKFNCIPIRRVSISYKGGKRFLSMPSIYDKIVQKALRMLMSPIFDANFLDVSHGFRPEKSCHTALNSIF